MAAFQFGEGFVRFTGRDSQFQRVARRVRAVAARVQQSLMAAGQAARRMMLIGGVAIGGVVRQSMNFGRAMYRVQALSGATTKQFVQMEKVAKSLGRTTVYTAGQVADAMGSLALAGFTTTEIVAAMPHTLNLAAAGQLEMAQAADITAKIMRGMRMEVSEMEHAVDVLAQAMTTSLTDLVQLGNAMRYVGPVAKAAGQSFEQTTAIIQALSDANVQASLAGTTLRGVLVRLSGGGGKVAQKIFKDLGLVTTDSTGKVKHMADIVDEINAAMTRLNMGPAARTAAMMQAFGLRAGPGMTVLLGVGGDALRKLEAALESAGGRAKSVADIQLQGLYGAWVRMKSAVDGVAIAIGSTFHDSLVRLLKPLTDLAVRITEMSDVMKQAIVIVTGVTAAVLALTVALGYLAAHPIVAVIAGIVGLMAWFTDLSKLIVDTTATIKWAFTNWRLLMEYTFVSMAHQVVKFAMVVKHWFTVVIPDFLKWLRRNWRTIFEDIGRNTMTVFMNMAENIKYFFLAMQIKIAGGDWYYVWKPLREGLQRTLEELPRLADRTVVGMEKALEHRRGTLGDKIADLWQSRPGLAKGIDWGWPPPAPSPTIGGAAAQIAGKGGAAAPALGAATGKPAFVGMAQAWKDMQIRLLGGKKTVEDKQLAEQKTTNQKLDKLTQTIEQTEKDRKTIAVAG